MRMSFNFIGDIVTHPVICIGVLVDISNRDSVAFRDSATTSCFNPISRIPLEKSAPFKKVKLNASR